jgi:hypothetical protein
MPSFVLQDHFKISNMKLLLTYRHLRKRCKLSLRKQIALKTFYSKLSPGLIERGWQQSKVDPCLFMKPGMKCVVYVDDIIIGALDIPDINREIVLLGILDKPKKCIHFAT